MTGGAEGGHAVAPAVPALAQLAAVDEVGKWSRSDYKIIYLLRLACNLAVYIEINYLIVVLVRGVSSQKLLCIYLFITYFCFSSNSYFHSQGPIMSVALVRRWQSRPALLQRYSASPLHRCTAPQSQCYSATPLQRWSAAIGRVAWRHILPAHDIIYFVTLT